MNLRKKPYKTVSSNLTFEEWLGIGFIIIIAVLSIVGFGATQYIKNNNPSMKSFSEIDNWDRLKCIHFMLDDLSKKECDEYGIVSTTTEKDVTVYFRFFDDSDNKEMISCYVSLDIRYLIGGVIYNDEVIKLSYNPENYYSPIIIIEFLMGNFQEIEYIADIKYIGTHNQNDILREIWNLAAKYNI